MKDLVKCNDCGWSGKEDELFDDLSNYNDPHLGPRNDCPICYGDEIEWIDEN